MAEDELSCSTECRESEADSRNLIDLHSTEDNEHEDTNAAESNSYDSSDGGLLRCDRCDFETACDVNLASHILKCQADERRKLFECDICQMKFSNGANMRRHKMRHTGVKPYECKVCQKRFFRKDHLAEHYTTHTKTLPFHCPVCNRGFQRQIAMRAHFQNEHVGQNEIIKSCPLCSYRAGSMKSLRIHFFNRHGIDLDKLGTREEGRQEDNSTPPMHFLTPQVEISMSESTNQPFSPKQQGESECSGGEASEGSSSPPRPNVSLIPIKQEPPSQDNPPPPPSTLSSLIKVSPLKSLLCEEPRQVGQADPLLSGLQADSLWDPRPKHMCQYCSIVFPDRTLYFLHKGCHSADSNPWKCNICGEQTSNVYDFNSHLLSKTHR